MTPTQLRELTGAWPGVSEDIKWGNDLCLMVAHKMFCVTDIDGGALCIKVSPERFLELTDLPGIIPAPYLARAHWIKVQPDALPAAQRDALVRGSYEIIRAKLPKSKQGELAD